MKRNCISCAGGDHGECDCNYMVRVGKPIDPVLRDTRPRVWVECRCRLGRCRRLAVRRRDQKFWSGTRYQRRVGIVFCGPNVLIMFRYRTRWWRLPFSVGEHDFTRWIDEPAAPSE